MTRPANDDIIRASELGEYVYCARAWWLRRVQGVASHNVAALRSGQQAHDRHGHSVAAAQTQRRLAAVLAVLALFFLLAAAVAALLGGGL